ncbi:MULTISPECIES: alpha/beta hydrolase [unclassified Streptomyces]|uniref:alpha/beta fold hydrolase n=1 Tax=unclassified Streptomyces TaxID=2593676 RepID=UPI002E82147C|nr:alpha/beta hydrolase [Streptomyces sp. NBC_00589]WTI34152.1 alpha/beta hydrolase [Streptomyces sp. NBC_00775]WUB32175.1 alpha/beta hydrolase [Streptomyces sp. NBC_00589]
MPYFESPVDGARLHFVDYGPADGQVVVFVNSSYFGTEMWEYQMLPLAEDGFRCVGFDRRGHGRSDDVWGGFDLDSLADDLDGLLRHLDLREVTLAGHSLGTAEIVRCLTRHGAGRVAGVALVAGMVPGAVRSVDHPGGVDPALIRAGNDTFRRDRAAFFADGARAFFALDLPGNDLSEAYVRSMVDRCHGATARAGAALGDLVVTLNVAPELAKLDLPVLVVHGTHDASAPLDLTGRRSAELLPDSTLKVYENAGHGLFATHAERLTADLREFITRS